MADTKITGLLTPQVTTNPATDVLPIVNIADTLMAASGSTRKITVNQLLGSGGTATLASATITGDLTVDTSTLKVVSSTDRVGIGTASPAKRCEINQSANAFTTIGEGEILRLIGDDGNTVGRITEIGFGTGPTGAVYAPVTLGAINTSNAGYNYKAFYIATRTGTSDIAPVERYRIANDGVATWSNVGGGAGTAMTLNATGLGVGGAPIASHLITSQGPVAISGTGGGTRTSYISNTNACSIYYTDGGGSGYFTDYGNLIIQPRTSAGRSVVIATSAAAGTPVERLIVDPNGNVGISSGNLVMSTSGKGVDFSAVTGGTGTPTANVLNDYEEGTFTPTIVGTTGAGTGTYTTQLGRYTKVGRIVTCDISLVWTAHTGTGNIDIGGLPFSVLNTTGYAASAVIGYIDNIALTAGNIPMAVLWWFNTTKIRLNQTPTGGGAAAGVPMDSAGQINLSITYIVA